MDLVGFLVFFQFLVVYGNILFVDVVFIVEVFEWDSQFGDLFIFVVYDFGILFIILKSVVGIIVCFIISYCVFYLNFGRGNDEEKVIQFIVVWLNCKFYIIVQ